jgi:uncharacterized protein YaiI (UPF0178 family)
MKPIGKTSIEKKLIRGMELADYKDIEREARNQIIIGRKITLAAELLLDDAHSAIHMLGGKTSDEEDDAAKELREKDNDRNTIAS